MPPPGNHNAAGHHDYEGKAKEAEKASDAVNSSKSSEQRAALHNKAAMAHFTARDAAPSQKEKDYHQAKGVDHGEKADRISNALVTQRLHAELGKM